MILSVMIERWFVFHFQAVKLVCAPVCFQMSDQTTEGGFSSAERSTVSSTTTANVPSLPLSLSLISFIAHSFQAPLIKLIHLCPLIPSTASTHPVKGTSRVACYINKTSCLWDNDTLAVHLLTSTSFPQLFIASVLLEPELGLTPMPSPAHQSYGTMANSQSSARYAEGGEEKDLETELKDDPNPSCASPLMDSPVAFQWPQSSSPMPHLSWWLIKRHYAAIFVPR